jgi:hypothetical protein
VGNLFGGGFVDKAMDQNGIRLRWSIEFANVTATHMPSCRSLSYSIPASSQKIKRKLPNFMNLLKISIDKAEESWYTEAVTPKAAWLAGGELHDKNCMIKETR